MGASIDFMIEYDDSDSKPFEADIDGVIDFSKSFDIVHSKPYELMQAIVGIRGSQEIKPKIKPRGFPQNMNYMVKGYFADLYGMDHQYAGWLYPSEFIQCLNHASINKSDLAEPIQLMIETMEKISNRIGDERVRLIFAIST
jgi:hypothetical protein